MTINHKHTHTRPAFLNPAAFVLTSRFSAFVLLPLAMLVLGFAGWRVGARRATVAPDNSQTQSRQNGLAAALNPDGSLRAGASGSFDVSGFRMEFTPTGAPRFVPAAQQTACSGWDTQFSLPNGVDGYVSALAVSGSDLYVGGKITFVGNISVNNIAKFNTATGVWSALGTGGGNGVNSDVAALAVSGSDLYVGGYFTTANLGGTTVNANRVAKFNTMTGVWSALGTNGGNGASDSVFALAMIGSDLYVGGRFRTANVGGTTISANRVAKVNTLTNTWSALGTTGNGVSGPGSGIGVSALAVSGSDLYVGGDFDYADAGDTPVSAHSVAKFNATNGVWSALGTNGDNGVSGTVSALAVIGSDLYVGGRFEMANAGAASVSVKHIAKVNTTTGVWSKLGTDGNGVGGTIFPRVSDLAVIGSDLYVGGSFLAANMDGTTVSTSLVAKFNTLTNTWSALGTGGGNGVEGPPANSEPYVAALAISGSELYVGGDFTTANVGGTTASANRVAKFNTTTGVWSGIGMNGNGVSGTARAFTESGTVRALAVSGTDIYVGGDFNFVGNIAANHLAKFNTLTNTWSTIGSGGGNGVNGYVYTMVVSGSDLYVGGIYITEVNVGGTTVSVNHVAKVNTATGVWSALGTGSGNGVSETFSSQRPYVAALAVIGNDLYVGGSFRRANVGGTTVIVNNIAKVNTITGVWSRPGTNGLGNGVSALAVIGSDLYVGGGFVMMNVGGTAASAYNIAKFNTLNGTWSALGTNGVNGVNDSVSALAVIGSDLYVGGIFTTANMDGTTVSVNRIAKFNTLTNTWGALGTNGGNGVDGPFVDLPPYVTALTVIGNDLYVGGDFAMANAGGTSVNANRVAKFNTLTGVWSALADMGGGNGVNDSVFALAVSGSDLYVGGYFILAGDNKVSRFIGRFPALGLTAVMGLTRVAGKPGSNSRIATVGQSASALTVTVNGGASATVNGVTVAGLSLNAAGQVNAGIVAATNATTADFTVRVSDGAGCLFNETTLTVTVVKFSGDVSDPLVCTGPGNTVAVTLVLGNPNAAPLAVSDLTTFTHLVGVPGSCTVMPNVGACSVTAASLTYTATLAANQTVTLSYLTQVADNVPPGAQVCTNNAASFGGGAPVNLQICGTVNCPTSGPGLPLSATSAISDQKAGSVLVYNIYTSASDPTRQNTRIALTNTHPTLSAAVHLFFVDGASCSVADANVCLTANQTVTFQASDLDPGTTGYIVAVAIGADGCPINFNYLIGEEFVKFSSGHAANLGAEAIAALAGGLPSCDANSVTAQLNFDGVSYNRAPRALALDNIPSRADGNDTMLILNRFGGNLGIGAGTLINLFGIMYDDSESSVSFGFGGSSSSPGMCQFRSSLSNAFPRVTPRFETFIPAGRSGWARIYSQSDIGLLGAVLNLNPNAGANDGAFTGGRNLHKLTLTSAAALTIPIFPPSC